MDFLDCVQAQREVWMRQGAAGLSRTWFRVSASGWDASTWTGDAEGEKLFRVVLKELNIRFEEGDEQWVVTWVSGLF